MKIEVCVDSLDAALVAQNANADRIELCGDLSVGGITASLQLVTNIYTHIHVPIMMMIRPRGGNFVYNQEEVNIMLESIEIAKQYGFKGVVLGALTANADIDIPLTRYLVNKSKPLEVTFHRAFDLCNNPQESIQSLIDIGVDRLLTSGQEQTAIEGAKLISEIVHVANDKLIIMPGSGVSHYNISQLVSITQAEEYHGSFKGENGIISGENIVKIRKHLES